MKKQYALSDFLYDDIRDLQCVEVGDIHAVYLAADVDTAQLRAGHTSKSMTLRVYSRKIRKVTALR